MASHLDHQHIEELLAAYALDAVESDEADIVGAHLHECPRCAAEVAEHRESATLLSFVGAPAPQAVWLKIAQNLEDVAPPISLSTARTQSRATRAFATVAAIAAALTAVLGVQVVRQGQRMDRLTVIADHRGIDEAAAAALVTSGSKRARLTSNDGKHAVNAVVLPDGHGYLVGAQLPSLPNAQTYQLWGVIGAQTISLGVLGHHPSVTAFKAAGPLTALAITIEAAGGVVAPTRAPIVQGFIAQA